MVKRWDADQEKPGSPTSIDVLVRWLQTPGKYKSWKSEAKNPFTDEIISEIKKHKASNRSPSAIRRKIFKLEQQYETATNWLRSEGHLAAYLNGESDDGVNEKVLERCPLFHELSAAFQSIDNNGDNGPKDQNQKEDNTKEVVDTSAEEIMETVTVPTTQGKRKRDSDAVDVKKTKIFESLVVQADPVVLEKPVDVLQPARYNETSLVLAEFRKESESRWIKYCGVNIPTYSGETGGKVAEQILQREMEHVDDIAKLRFEGEQKRQGLYTRYATALSRYKLRSAGLPEEDVNSTVPQ